MGKALCVNLATARGDRRPGWSTAAAATRPTAPDFTEALRIASLAEQHGVSIAPHTAPHIHAHIVAAFGASAFGVESHGDPDRHPIHHGLYTEGPTVRNGMVHLNDLPGFGIAIDWAFVKKHQA